MEDIEALTVAERHVAREGEVQFDPHVHEGLGGMRIVHGQQQYRGLSIYPHSIVVRIAADGRIASDGDAFLPVAHVPTVPRIDARKAVLAAYGHVRDGTGSRCHTPHAPRFVGRRYRPTVVASFPMPNRPTVLTPGPFGEPVQANLVIARESVRLAWVVSLYVRRVADFTIVVAASGEDAGRVLYCAVEAASVVCTGNVYRFNPDEEPSVEMRFPRPFGDYPAGIRPTADFPDWVESNRAIGNNVETLFENQSPKIRLTPGGPEGRRFVTATGSDDEQVINGFFLCNFAHDFFSLVGFGEKDGNFQQTNFSGDGKDGDRLVLSIVDDAQGDANLRAQNDGKPVELTLGTFDAPNGQPTALDADIVLHEFAHGVSQRLVGGKGKKGALLEAQSVALGEAWSDYFAITIQNSYRAAPRFTFGAFASQNPNGIRPTMPNAVPYDQFQAHFGMLGTPPFDEQHGAGTVFAAALIRMQTELQALLGKEIGDETGWKLVIHSLKALAANPTFLDARDEILRAIPELQMPAQTVAIEATIRGAFARFGMGRNARCNSTAFSGITADFTL
jgi:extracellular elastinolytic metalloproteinase